MKNRFTALLLSVLLLLVPAGTLAEATSVPEADATARPTVDSATVLARIYGKNITYADVSEAYRQLVSQYSTFLDVEDESIANLLMTQALEIVVQNRVLLHKAEELGFYPLPEPEEQALREQVQITLDEIAASIAGENADEAALQQAREALTAYGYTLEGLTARQAENQAMEKVYTSVIEDVALADEQVRARFETEVAQARAEYEADPSAYDADVYAGADIYFVPEGVRTVKHILIALEDAAELQGLYAQLADEALDADARAAAQARVDQIMEDVQPRLDEIAAKLADHMDFQLLIDLYGEDPGMQPGSTFAADGYPVTPHTAMDPVFLETALALEKVGDVSQPVLGSYGFHIIRYEGDLTAGPVEFEVMREAVEESALAAARTEAYQQAMSAWIAESDLERME